MKQMCSMVATESVSFKGLNECLGNDCRVARLLVPERDDPLLERLEEDGSLIEPRHFVPILPLVRPILPCSHVSAPRYISEKC